MLKQWLESEGFGTVDVGLARSTLVSAELEQAKDGNVLGRTTQLAVLRHGLRRPAGETGIIPALAAGFIVLADPLRVHAHGARHRPRRGSSLSTARKLVITGEDGNSVEMSMPGAAA